MEFLKVCAVIFGVLMTIFLSVFFISAVWTYTWYRPACEDFGKGMKLHTEFHFWHGCFVTMPDGRVLPDSTAKDILRQEYLFKFKQEK